MIEKLLAILAMGFLTLTGCHAIDFYTPVQPTPVSPELTPPRELAMTSLPAYRIAPPDMLTIQVLKLVPRPAYRIEAFDTLQIDVLGTLPERPIKNYFLVEGEGIVTLGPPYGIVRVMGLTIEEAQAAITGALKFILKNPEVAVDLVRTAATEQLTDAYRVYPDGTIRLHTYGAVHVAGMSVTEARAAVQQRLSQFFDGPQVGLDVTQYNSACYYIIAGIADKDGNTWRYPITGNETVLDALAASGKAGKILGKTVWIVRPAAGDANAEQVLPVDWNAVICGGRTATNYQVLPGDRIYIADDSVVAAQRFIMRVTGPVERLFGITNEGLGTVYSAEVLGRDYNTRRNN
jgi:polysaccharide export outer membrane protein